jgi:uncharacterized membrane-anchored protein YitT (DUF2179 family)
MSTAAIPDAIEPEPVRRHSLFEDVLALVLGTTLVALGLTLYAKASLGTGGVAGVALLGHYATGLGFGPIFFAVNLPFYALSVRRMGWPFTLRTFAAVGLVSILAVMTPRWVDIATLQPLYATVAGGGLIGVGLLILFRHRAGLGGINILAVYLQDNHGIRAGYFQLGVDAVILAASFFVLPWWNVVLSLAGAVVINMILAINHRPGRYLGMS